MTPVHYPSLYQISNGELRRQMVSLRFALACGMQCRSGAACCVRIHQSLMTDDENTLTNLYREFFDSERTGGYLLITCTVISLALANSIVVITAFYAKGFSLLYVGLFMGIFVMLLIFNRLGGNKLLLYLIPGMCIAVGGLADPGHGEIRRASTRTCGPVRGGRK
jgi:hypothetical protein